MRTTQQFMTKRPITVRDTDPVSEAKKKMQSFEVRHLPVVGSTGAALGIISDRDVQRAGVNPAHTVKDYMSVPLQAVGTGTPLRKVAQQMLEKKISSFVVEDAQGKMVGIITTDDILKAFLTTESQIWDSEVQAEA